MSRDIQCLVSPTHPMTHYRCVKFDPQSEVELIVRKFKKKRSGKKARKEKNGNEQEHAESNLSNGAICDDFAPIGTIFFTLLSGQAESFGIPITDQRLYSIDFDQRFILQTFESGFELCFLVQNLAENDILGASIQPHDGQKNKMQFVPLKSPFTSYNLKTQTLDAQLLSTLIQLNSSDLQLSPQLTISWNKAHERYRLGINTKCYQKKQSNWLYPKYVDIANDLNRQRQEATNTNQAGPNVIILGPCDAGKSTLAKLIINYAINEQYSPMYVDLDVGQGAIGVPGIIGAGIIDKHCQLDQEYNFCSGHPIQVHFGNITPGSNKDIHKLSVNCLVAQIEHFLRSEEEQREVRPNQMKVAKRTLTKCSGLVINTHGWIDGYGYESTLDAIRKFSVSTVLVLGDSQNNWNVTHKSGSQIQVHYFPPNNSTKKRSQKLRGRIRIDRFARYFLNQTTTVSIPFKKHLIFRFYTWNRFSQMLKSKDKPKQNEKTNGNWPLMRPNQINPANYKICKVEMIDKDRGRRNRVVFYHLNQEMLVQLKNRVLSMLSITIDQLQNQNNCFSLRELLQVRGYARVVQIDLETNSLLVELPNENAPMLCNGKLVLLLNETMLQNYNPKGKIDLNTLKVGNVGPPKSK